MSLHLLRPEGARDLRRSLLILFGAGLALRLLLVSITDGSQTDISGFLGVSNALHVDFFHSYSVINQGPHFSYPYPPLYLPAMYAIGTLSNHLDISFGRLLRLPEVGADLAIAWLVQWHMGFRGHSPRARAIATALIVFNPATIALSSMHGQIDPVQWLPAVAGLIAWERLPEGRRAPAAGLLIGIGIATKTVPGLLLLALLPLARDMRERGVLVGAAAVIPAIVLAPFLIADFDGTRHFTDYAGIPGQGGLSMIIQPSLALLRFSGRLTTESDLQQTVQDVAKYAVIVACLAVTVRAFQTRPEPAATAAALILCVFVFGANYFQPYITYLIPFIVLAGWTRFYAVITALMVLPLAFRYVPIEWSRSIGIAGHAYDQWAVWAFYIPPAALLWCAYVGRLGQWVRRPAPPRTEPATA